MGNDGSLARFQLSDHAIAEQHGEDRAENRRLSDVALHHAEPFGEEKGPEGELRKRREREDEDERLERR